MTDLSPERLAEIRAWTTDDVSVLPRHSGPTNAEIRALCDALAAAEKERDDLRLRLEGIIAKEGALVGYPEMDVLRKVRNERDAARAELAERTREGE